jgi:surface antigen
MVATTPADLPTDPSATTGGATVVINDVPTTTSYTPSTPLNAGVTSYWEVHGRNSTQYGTWSSVSHFATVTASLPGTPSSPNPADGAILAVQPATLDWADTPNANSYDVYLKAGSGSFTQVGVNLSSSQWAANQTYDATSFSWYVVAKNGAGSTQGPTWSYSISSSPGGLQTGARVMAGPGGANVRDAQLSSTPLFLQYAGVHGTIVGGPAYGTAGGFTGNWWKINWDSEPPNQNGYQGYGAESVISLAPSAGDVPQPTFSSSYYTTANHFWTQGDAPGTSVPGNPWPAGAYGNCTWYAYGRMLQLGYNSAQLAAIAPPGLGSAYQWGANAIGSTAVALGVTANTTPTAGSIAWLDSGSFSSLGHVAVVESVNSDGTVTVSESSYSTSSTSVWNFLWHHRTVTPTWFTKFIHVSSGGSAPPTPTANAATSITSSSFTANWNSSSGATGYRIDVSLSSTFSSYLSGGQDADMGNSLVAYVSGLSANTPYYYRVRAYNANGTSGNSGTITVTTTRNAPPAPVATAATSVTSSGFTANWNSSTGATGYRIDVSTSSTFNGYLSGYQDLDILNFLSRTVSGLSANTPYYYRVRAYNGGGASDNSGTITVVTSSSGGASSPTITSPQRAETTFTLSVLTQIGFNYTLEYKSSFSDANWTSVQTIGGTGGRITLMDTTATGPARLYHVHVQ